MKIYTLGYQGIDLGTYTKILVSSGVGLVIDVREVPWSHKRDFSKLNLQRALAEIGIDYIHVRSAGNPSENRKTAKSVDECLRRYRKHLKANPACLDEILLHINRVEELGHSVCLTCYEHDPEDCHRSILAEALLEQAPDIETIHLFKDGVSESK